MHAVEFALKYLTLVSILLNIIVCAYLIKRHYNEPDIKRWNDLEKWKDRINVRIEKIDNEIHDLDHKVEDLQHDYDDNNNFKVVMVKSLGCILDSIGSTDSIDRAKSDLNSFLAEMLKK